MPCLKGMPVGSILRTDTRKMPSVPGCFAAGDTARAPSNFMLAAADGVLAGQGLHIALVTDDAPEDA